MKITMKDFKENAMIGVNSGIVVTGILYFINKRYIKSMSEIYNEDVKFVENQNRLLNMQLEKLEIENDNTEK